MPERTNGKKHTININQIVYKELHRPQVTDGDSVFPIYTKVEGYRGNQYDTKAESSAKYKKRAATHFNSPNNIRKLYFTHNKIYIDYFKSPGVKQLDLPLQTQASLSTDLLEVLPKIANYRTELSKYMMEKNINPRAKGPDQYVLDGNVIGVINQVYTCNNIEEIYFDWTFLFSPSMQQLLANNGLGVLVGEAAIMGMLNGKPFSNNQLNKSNIWKAAFINNAFNKDEIIKIHNNPNKLRDKYPRLKIIAMINNLGDIITQSVRSYSLMFELKKSGGTSTWLETNSDLVNSSKSIMIVTQLDGVPKLNPKFVTQESAYVFDKEFSKWVDTYAKAIEAHARQIKYGTMNPEDNEEDSTDDTNLNEVEQRMLQIESEVGPETFKKILIGTTKVGSQFKLAELRSLFRTFTKPNRVRWAKMIGLVLE